MTLRDSARTDRLPLRRWLVLPEGLRVRAEYWECPGSDEACVVLVHGFSASLDAPANREIAAAVSVRAPTIAVELRGHGASPGASTLGDLEVAEVSAAIRWAHTLGHGRVVTIGFSMGGGVVLRHAGLTDEVDGVVAISPPAFWNYHGTLVMRRLHFGILNPIGRGALRIGMGTRVARPSPSPMWPTSPEMAAESIAPIPLLVVHGSEDAFFPEEHARAIHRAAVAGAVERGAPALSSEVWLVDGFGHAEVGMDDPLLARVMDWVATRSASE